MGEIITSSKNQQLKNIGALLKSKKDRDEQGLFVIEGFRIFKDAVKSASDKIVQVYMSESFYNDALAGKYPEAESLISDCDGAAQSGTTKDGSAAKYGAPKDSGTARAGYTIIKDSVFDGISGTVTPQGIMCVMKKPEYSLDGFFKTGEQGNKYLLLEDIQDPGNLGTMVRTAEAAGIAGILMSSGTVDIYNPKVTRATMGSIFRVPFLYTTDFVSSLETAKANGIRIFAAYLHGGRSYREVEFPKNYGILIGNEGNGLSDAAVDASSERIFIPMCGEIESLNAAVAAAILCFR